MVSLVNYDKYVIRFLIRKEFCLINKLKDINMKNKKLLKISLGTISTLCVTGIIMGSVISCSQVSNSIKSKKISSNSTNPSTTTGSSSSNSNKSSSSTTQPNHTTQHNPTPSPQPNPTPEPNPKPSPQPEPNPTPTPNPTPNQKVKLSTTNYGYSNGIFMVQLNKEVSNDTEIPVTVSVTPNNSTSTFSFNTTVLNNQINLTQELSNFLPSFNNGIWQEYTIQVKVNGVTSNKIKTFICNKNMVGLFYNNQPVSYIKPQTTYFNGYTLKYLGNSTQSITWSNDANISSKTLPYDQAYSLTDLLNTHLHTFNIQTSLSSTPITINIGQINSSFNLKDATSNYIGYDDSSMNAPYNSTVAITPNNQPWLNEFTSTSSTTYTYKYIWQTKSNYNTSQALWTNITNQPNKDAFTTPNLTNAWYGVSYRLIVKVFSNQSTTTPVFQYTSNAFNINIQGNKNFSLQLSTTAKTTTNNNQTLINDPSDTKITFNLSTTNSDLDLLNNKYGVITWYEFINGAWNVIKKGSSTLQENWSLSYNPTECGLSKIKASVSLSNNWSYLPKESNTIDIFKPISSELKNTYTQQTQEWLNKTYPVSKSTPSNQNSFTMLFKHWLSTQPYFANFLNAHLMGCYMLYGQIGLSPQSIAFSDLIGSMFYNFNVSWESYGPSNEKYLTISADVIGPESMNSNTFENVCIQGDTSSSSDITMNLDGSMKCIWTLPFSEKQCSIYVNNGGINSIDFGSNIPNIFINGALNPTILKSMSVPFGLQIVNINTGKSILTNNQLKYLHDWGFNNYWNQLQTANPIKVIPFNAWNFDMTSQNNNQVLSLNYSNANIPCYYLNSIQTPNWDQGNLRINPLIDQIDSIKLNGTITINSVLTQPDITYTWYVEENNKTTQLSLTNSIVNLSKIITNPQALQKYQIWVVASYQIGQVAHQVKSQVWNIQISNGATN